MCGVLHGESSKHLAPPRNTKDGEKKKKGKTDRTSRQTQAGIGHSAPAHRGGQGTPTINTNDRQKAQLTDQAPGTIDV